LISPNLSIPEILKFPGVPGAARAGNASAAPNKAASAATPKYDLSVLSLSDLYGISNLSVI